MLPRGFGLDPAGIGARQFFLLIVSGPFILSVLMATVKS